MSTDGARLTGVPETTLWTLVNRASEAARPDGTIEDPLAVEVLAKVGPVDPRRFGGLSQSHPLRARTFDAVLADRLREFPDGPVVALGEGLQTTFWRLSRPPACWFSVDLPEIVVLRRDLLPADERIRPLAASALDDGWLDEVAARTVDPAAVTITAEGLLMYFTPEQVRGLLARCAERFPGAVMVFDTIPSWFSRRTVRGLKLSRTYVAPPMPWGVSPDAVGRLPDQVPGLASVREIPLAFGRGAWGSPLLRRAGDLPWLRRHRPGVFIATFAR